MAASNSTIAREKPTNEKPTSEKRYDTISSTREEPRSQPAVMETVPAEPPPSYRETPSVRFIIRN